MDLFCCETENIIRSHFDPVILADPRIVLWLLDVENQYIVTENYFGNVQDVITPDMRRICLTWLMEVSDNEKCEDAVFPLAANYLDRFLSTVRIAKGNLQLLGCVCLMLATKLRQSKPLSSGLLAAYTDYAYSALDIVNWESAVLNTLKWKLAAVIPHDYLDTILYRLPDFHGIKHVVQGHAKIFQQLSALEFEFSAWPPSLIALATIGAAIKGLPKIEIVWPPAKNLPQIFYEMTDIDIGTIENCIEYMEAFVNKCINNVQRTLEAPAAVLTRKSNGDFSRDDKPDTPTDVKDVKF